jgi:hypothetical protein
MPDSARSDPEACEANGLAQPSMLAKQHLAALSRQRCLIAVPLGAQWSQIRQLAPMPYSPYSPIVPRPPLSRHRRPLGLWFQGPVWGLDYLPACLVSVDVPHRTRVFPTRTGSLVFTNSM